MLDAVQLAMTNIYHSIPTEILDIAFEPWNHPDTTLDELIRKEVILSRVKNDVSIRCGPVMDLVLNLDWTKFTSSPSPYALGISGSYSAFKVPPEARQHRDISCVLSVRFPYTIQGSSTAPVYNTCTVSGNTLSGLACAALQSRTGAGQVSSPTGQVKAGNVIILDPPAYNFVPWQVTVRLVCDDNFSNMDVSSLKPFEQVCLYAVQAYIYTRTIVRIESNLVMRGADVGVIRSIVDSYNQANEKYEEELMNLGGASVYSPDRLKHLLTMMVPRG